MAHGSNAVADEAEAQESFVQRTARELGLEPRHLRACVALLAQGNEVPFIVRYRADAVGGLGGPAAHAVAAHLSRHRCLAAARAKVLKAAVAAFGGEPGLGEAESELRRLVLSASTAGELEALHAPFKPPAKGTLAERAAAVPGLKDQADLLWAGTAAAPLRATLLAGGAAGQQEQLRAHAVALLSARCCALPGPWAAVRGLFARAGTVTAKAKKAKKKDTSSLPPHKIKGSLDHGGRGGHGGGDLGSAATYDGFACALHRLRPHQALALERGVEKGLLAVSVALPPASSGNPPHPQKTARHDQSDRLGVSAVTQAVAHALPWLGRHLGNRRGGSGGSGGSGGGEGEWEWAASLVAEAAADAFQRSLKRRAAGLCWRDAVAAAQSRGVAVFQANLAAALLAPGLLSGGSGGSGGSRSGGCFVVALDPGHAHGVKGATLDPGGAVVDFIAAAAARKDAPTPTRPQETKKRGREQGGGRPEEEAGHEGGLEGGRLRCGSRGGAVHVGSGGGGGGGGGGGFFTLHPHRDFAAAAAALEATLRHALRLAARVCGGGGGSGGGSGGSGKGPARARRGGGSRDAGTAALPPVRVVVAVGDGHGSADAQALAAHAAAAAMQQAEQGGHGTGRAPPRPATTAATTTAAGEGVPGGASSARPRRFAVGGGAATVVEVMVVPENGASVWSATEEAADEFPGVPPAALGAVSIGRRLQDPLSELVKIPPRSLGLGMYQHSHDAKALDAALRCATKACAAAKGVDANTASPRLLSLVPGLNPKTAAALVAARPFETRRALLDRVKGLGPVAFRNCAGFLVVRGGSEVLDATLVHPEAYALAKRLLEEVKRLVADAADTADTAKATAPGSGSGSGSVDYNDDEDDSVVVIDGGGDDDDNDGVICISDSDSDSETGGSEADGDSFFSSDPAAWLRAQVATLQRRGGSGGQAAEAKAEAAEAHFLPPHVPACLEPAIARAAAALPAAAFPDLFPPPSSSSSTATTSAAVSTAESAAGGSEPARRRAALARVLHQLLLSGTDPRNASLALLPASAFPCGGGGSASAAARTSGPFAAAARALPFYPPPPPPPPPPCVLRPLAPALAASLAALAAACPVVGVRGRVANVVDFGAFVDLGAETDGLLHRSRFPPPGAASVSSLYPGAVVAVDVLGVDLRRRRIELAWTTSVPLSSSTAASSSSSSSSAPPSELLASACSAPPPRSSKVSAAAAAPSTRLSPSAPESPSRGRSDGPRGRPAARKEARGEGRGGGVPIAGRGGGPGNGRVLLGPAPKRKASRSRERSKKGKHR